MRVLRTLIVLLAVLVSACVPAAARYTSTAAVSIPPAVSATLPATVTRTASTPTPTASPRPSDTITPTLHPTDPRPTATYDNLRRSRPAVRRHGSKRDFGLMKFMQAYIPLVQ